MLKFMRKNTGMRNAIIVVVSVALAGYMFVGMGEAPVTAQGDTVAKVGSTRIKLRDIVISVENTRQSAQRFGFANQMQPEQINAMAANSVLQNAMILDGADYADIAVSDEELRETVINMRTNPDGSFVNDESWASYINYVYRQRVPSFEEYLRNHELRIDKYQRLFSASVYISERDISDRFTKNNKQVKLDMLVLNTFDVRTEVDMNDDEKLKKFYEENPDEFKSGDLRQVRFVTFPINDYREQVQVGDADIQDYYQANIQRYTAEKVLASHVLINTENRSEEEALKEITRIRQEITDGLDFAEAATKYSDDDVSKVRGGDLGFFQRNRMVPEFAEEAFSMEVGALSDPVKTQFGYHLIQKYDHQQNHATPLQEVRTTISSVLFREKAKEYATNLARAFHTNVLEADDFEQAAKDQGYEVKESRFFDNDNRSNLGDVLQQSFQVRRAAFNLNEIGDLTEPTDAGSQIVVAKWTAEKEPQPLEFEADKSRIRFYAEKAASQAFIRDFFDKFRAKAGENPDKTFKELQGEEAFLKDNHFKATEWVGAANLPWELNSANLDFEKDVYAVAVGDFLDNAPGAADTRFVLAKVVDKQEPDMAKLAEERIKIAEELRQEAGLEILSNWLASRQEALDPDQEAYQRVLANLSR